MFRKRTFLPLLSLLVTSGCQSPSGLVNNCADLNQSVAPILRCVSNDISDRQVSNLDAAARIQPEAESFDNDAKKVVSDAGVNADLRSPTEMQSLSSSEKNISTANSTAMNISEAVRLALKDSPAIGSAVAAKRELAANINAARAAYYPHLQMQAGSGHDVTGIYSTVNQPNYWERSNATGAWRSDAGLSGTQLLYDFGATAADVDRAAKAHDAQALKSMSAIEDVSLNTALAFLQVQQSRELLTLANDNLKALKAIASLIQKSEQNGNGTKADLQRVNARVIDAQAALADQDFELKLSIEKLKRLVHVDPGTLPVTPVYEAKLPASPASALSEALKRSPAVLADLASIESARADTLGISSSSKPKLSVETDANGKNYRGQYTHTDIAYRGMLTLSYQLADGGLSAAKREAASARETQAELKSISTREELEANIRRFYLQLNSNRAKQSGLESGVMISEKARELYREQFGGGKRTLLELLEVQNSYYIARFNKIGNSYDLRRAVYGILHSVGRLTAALLG